MKVVIDTNVLVSGFFFTGAPSRILKAWKAGQLEPVMTAEIFDEYREVLIRLSGEYPSIEVGALIDLIAVEIPIVKPRKLRRKVCDDVDDDKFFACALAAGIKVIISGDKHLLRESGTFDVVVLKPAEFVANYL